MPAAASLAAFTALATHRSVTRSGSTVVCQDMHVMEQSIDSPQRASLRVVPLSMLAGAALGLCYGVIIRLWMRFISEDPEFSWSGTVFIVGAFTVSFAFAGLVVAGRRRGWKALMVLARTIAIVVSLPCFGAAGALMLPTIVLGSLAVARADWPTIVRRGLGVLSAVSIVLVLRELSGLSVGRLAVGAMWYLGLVIVEIRILSEPYRPTVGRLPAMVKVVAGIAALVAVVGPLTFGS